MPNRRVFPLRPALYRIAASAVLSLPTAVAPTDIVIVEADGETAVYHPLTAEERDRLTPYLRIVGDLPPAVPAPPRVPVQPWEPTA